jgi:hypothetical protein
MTSSQGDDQNAQGNQRNDMLVALVKSLNLDDRSSGCEPSDKDVTHPKVRVHKELLSPAGVAAVPPIDENPCAVVHEVDRRPEYRRAVGTRLVRTIAFGVLTGVMVCAFVWYFYGDAHRGYMVETGKLANPPSSSVVPLELASQTSDGVPAQDHAALAQEQAALPTQEQAALPIQQAAPVLLPAQVSVAPGPSPELQGQLASIVSDVAAVRRIVERLAAVQEKMALDIATLQKLNSNTSQKASLVPHSPAAPVRSRKYAPNIVRSTPSVSAPSTPARTTLGAPLKSQEISTSGQMGRGGGLFLLGPK